MEMVTLAGIMLTKLGVSIELSKGKDHIISYRTVYKVYQDGDTYKAKKIAYKSKQQSYVPMVPRGRYIFATEEYANSLLNM